MASAPFGAAVDALFADPNLARDATWSGVDGTVRVITKRPDATLDFGQTGLAVATILIDVRVSEVPAPRASDVVAIGDEAFRVVGEPMRRDPVRLIWTVEAVPNGGSS